MLRKIDLLRKDWRAVFAATTLTRVLTMAGKESGGARVARSKRKVNGRAKTERLRTEAPPPLLIGSFGDGEGAGDVYRSRGERRSWTGLGSKSLAGGMIGLVTGALLGAALAAFLAHALIAIPGIEVILEGRAAAALSGAGAGAGLGALVGALIGLAVGLRRRRPGRYRERGRVF